MDEMLRSSTGRLARLGLGAILTLGAGSTPAFAQGPSASVASWTQAVKQTQSTGATSVLVVTSARSKGSRELYRSLAGSPAIAALRGRVVLAELSAEADADQIDRLGLTSPSVVAFRKGATGGLERAGSYSGSISPDELVAWLNRRGLIGAAVTETTVSLPAADPSVEKASFGGHGSHPTPQQAPQPVPYYPPPQPQVIYAPAPPPVEREVEYVREVAAPREREVIVEREVEYVREAPAPRRVVVREAPAPREREVIVEREAPTTRSLLTRPREVAAPREREVVVERAAPAPRQVVVREVAAPREREVIVEREVAAPREREVVVEREAPARRVVAAPRAALGASDLNLVRPGPVDRALGALGNRLRKRGLPRVALEVETEETYRLAPAPTTRVIAAPAPVYAQQPQPQYVQQYIPQPQYVPQPQHVPSPQQQQ